MFTDVLWKDTTQKQPEGRKAWGEAWGQLTSPSSSGTVCSLEAHQTSLFKSLYGTTGLYGGKNTIKIKSKEKKKQIMLPLYTRILQLENVSAYNGFYSDMNFKIF